MFTGNIICQNLPKFPINNMDYNQPHNQNSQPKLSSSHKQHSNLINTNYSEITHTQTHNPKGPIHLITLLHTHTQKKKKDKYSNYS